MSFIDKFSFPLPFSKVSSHYAWSPKYTIVPEKNEKYHNKKMIKEYKTRKEKQDKPSSNDERKEQKQIQQPWFIINRYFS